VRDDPVAPMKAFVEWARSNGKRGFCGEFGCSVNRRGLEACRALLDLIEGSPDVFYGWAWWGGGGPWQPDYVFLLDPFASITSPTNPDPKGSITWENPVDRPQMKLLQHYLAGTTQFNGWLIEDQLAAHLAALYRHGDFDVTSGAWIDSGPLDNHAIAGRTTAPSIEDDGGVSFAASGQCLSIEQTSRTSQGESVYAVVKMPADAAAQERTILGSNVDGGRRFGLNADRRVSAGPSGQPLAPVHAGEAVPIDTLALIQASFAKPASANRANGYALAVDTKASANGPQAAPFADGRPIIGASDENGADGLGGTVHDLAIFDTVLSEQDNARVQGRLYWDKGMAHLLPADHPYRYRAPAIA
jgi:hypothetical protein